MLVGRTVAGFVGFVGFVALDVCDTAVDEVAGTVIVGIMSSRPRMSSAQALIAGSSGF